MISHFRKLIALPLALLMVFSLSSCEGIVYREAVDLYNNQKYAEAAEKFSQLDGYEDSAELHTRSLYQLAIADFEAENYAQAEKVFLEFPEYRQTPEYLRQINWQKFYDYICENGSDGGGCFVLSSQLEDRTVNAMVDFVDPGTIFLIATLEQDMGYVFRDEMTISLTRDSFDALYTAESTFIMDFNNMDIGSAQTSAGGISITTCTADMKLVPDTFTMTATDNQGNETNSTDFADGTMFEEMQKNYTAIMTAFPQMLADSGLTPADIGFENLA